MEKVKMGVVGTGVMGSYHLKNYANMKDKGVVLVGVYDVDKQRALKKAQEYNTEAFDDLEKLSEKIDAASVVTPSSTHFEVGKFLLLRGKHLLIEKPLAVQKQDCIELAELAKKMDVVLQVGHVERFNPAVLKLTEIFKKEKPVIKRIQAKRVNQSSDRITDVPVTSDLMIHDIDVVLSFIQNPIVKVQAKGDKDEAFADMVFENGTKASLKVSRKANENVRSLDIDTSLGLYHLDYAAQTLSHNGKEINVNKAFSLEKELVHFIDCVKHHKKPDVTAEVALDALNVLWQIEKLLPL